MATVALTARYLDQLKSHGKRYEVFDAIVPGLAIRVSASGRKTFTLYYRHHRRLRRVGARALSGRPLAKRRGRSRRSIAAASLMAPIPPARSRRSTRRTTTRCRRSTSCIADGRRRSCAAGPRCAASWRRKSCRSGGIGRSRISGAGHPRARGARRRRRPRSRAIACWNGSPRCSRLRVDQDWIEANPAWRIKKPGQERSRDRVLTRDELRELWPALHETEAKNADGSAKPRLSETLNDAFLVMLLTAQRCGEVCQMQWQEVDLATGWWSIPRRRLEESRPASGAADADGPGNPASGGQRRRTRTIGTCSRTIVIPAWPIGRRRPRPSSARAACRSTSARTTCDGPPRRTWAKRASTAFTSRTCSITAASRTAP